MALVIEFIINLSSSLPTILLVLLFAIVSSSNVALHLRRLLYMPSNFSR